MSMTYKQRDDFEKALNKISSMTVDEFQDELEKYKIDYWTIDSYIFDLAKVLMKNKSNERYIYSLKMESSNE